MYDTDIETIDSALKLFFDDDNGCHICSALFDFGIEMRVVGEPSSSVVNNITHDLWNISTLLVRLEWMRSLSARSQLHTESWRSFSGLDIENLFVQVRSSMDHATELIQHHLPKGKGGQLPDSFNKLHGSIDKYDSRLPEQLQKLIRSAKWFDQMRSIRDALVHQGGTPLVFGEPAESLQFQIYGKSMNGYVFHPALMFNENVVYFERYTALLLANLLVFLNDLGLILQSIESTSMKIGPVRSYTQGYSLLRGWMIETRQFLLMSPTERLTNDSKSPI